MKILRTADYGAGWSTWNLSNPPVAFAMLTYKPIIDYLSQDNTSQEKLSSLVEQMETELKEIYPVQYICTSGAENLMVDEISEEDIISKFLECRDGYESIRY